MHDHHNHSHEHEVNPDNHIKEHDHQKHCCCHHDELHHEPCHEQCHEHHHNHNLNCNNHADSHNCECRSHHECGCRHEHHNKGKSDLIRYAISGLLFVISFFSGSVPFLSQGIKLTAVILCGYKILFYGIRSLIKIKFDENTLMAVATIASAIMGDFSEAYLIVLLFSIGEYMEEYAVEKSHKRIEKLIDLTTDEAFDEKGNKIDAQSIISGDTLLIRPGDKIPIDGVIIKGNTSFDTSNLTGESVPVDLEEGKTVLAGCLNIGNAIILKATCDYSNSTTSKIKEYVKNASSQKASTEKFITRFAKIYTPVVIIASLAVGIILPVLNITGISEAVKRALTFMIASCPCALVISIPLSYYAAIGSASKSGILIKGSKHINTLAKSDAIVFDKTGTLTEGRLSVREIEILGSKTKEEILDYANALEVFSSHPIAKAIQDAATIKNYAAENVNEHFGKGIEGIVCGHRVSLGNNKLFSKNEPADKGGLVLSIDGKEEAVIKLSDTVKFDAKNTLEKLIKKTGVKNIYILSGDSQAEVDRICLELGNIRGIGNLLPNEKAEVIEQLKEKHKGVIYVGDGANDAPSLAKADFSVSIGSGSSLALETGDATLISRSLMSIVSVIRLAGYTMRIVYSNIAFSLFVKAIVLILATLGIAPIWLALFADVGVLVLAVINSLSVLYKKF